MPQPVSATVRTTNFPDTGSENIEVCLLSKMMSFASIRSAPPLVMLSRALTHRFNNT